MYNIYIYNAVISFLYDISCVLISYKSHLDSPMGDVGLPLPNPRKGHIRT